MVSPRTLALFVLASTPTNVVAQVVLDRADPTVIERTLPQSVTPTPVPNVARPPAATAQLSVPPITGVIRAVTVTGQAPVPLIEFAGAIAAIVGQELGRDGLVRAADSIAAVARSNGYPFATASIPPQPLADGILRVSVDLGRIDAVRVIGASNAAADRILARALRRGTGVRQHDLERALLLVGDLPGVRVVDSRFVRQDGFGILLVSIDSDPATAYVQIDNRGSKEVGPFRSTLLASVRNVAQDGDEFAVIASQTPLQLSEFAFLRARYTAPLTASGTLISIAGSLARSEPGGALAALDVIGRSADVAISVQQPLIRSRAQSWWAGLELRALGTNQMIAGQTLRRDRLTTLTGTLNGTSTFGGGVLRAELTTTAGLPFAGTTREGAPLASRVDGDAGFVSATYALDWVRPIVPRVSVNLATAGQVASRPLLAAIEVGVGGPTFARAYDYAERTGDQGVLGSVELRYDAGRVIKGLIDRAQLYGFVDGGMVDNLGQGIGGGSLASTGGGARLGTGRFDWLVEVAVPLNADRFDTGDRNPRLSLRLARAF